MDDYTEHLYLYSELLRFRLTRPTNIDTLILNPNIFHESNFKFNSCPSKFVGLLRIDVATQMPIFILAGKTRFESGFSHVYCIYINHPSKIIRDEENSLIDERIPPDARGIDGLFKGVINICTTQPAYFHFGILIECLEHLIHPTLISRPKRIRYVDADQLMPGLTYSPPSACRPNEDTTSLCNKVMTIAFQRKIRGGFYLLSRKVVRGRSSIVVLTHYNNHILCCMPAPDPYTDWLVVTPHADLFNNADAKNDLQEGLRSLCPDLADKINIQFIKFNFSGQNCCVELVMRYFSLAVLTFPWCIPVMRESDIDKILPVEFNDLNYNLAPYLRQLTPAPLYRTEFSGDTVFPILEPCDPLVYNSPPARQQASCSTNPFEYSVDQELSLSQNSALDESFDIRAYIRRSREQLNTQKLIRNSAHVPVHSVKPYHDPSGQFLITFPQFEEAIRYLVVLIDRIANCALLDAVNEDELGDYDIALTPGYRFHVLPILSGSGGYILITDIGLREYVLFNPDYKLGDPEFPALHLKLAQSIPVTHAMRCYGITMSSKVHTEFKRIHLIVGLYTVFRMFQFVTILPRRLIYGEEDIRNYCYFLALELQISNSEYNLKNGLIDFTGGLLEGAYVSYLSDMKVERGVVPKDICMLCCKRFKNLGSHISMTHNQQSLKMNLIKHRQE